MNKIITISILFITLNSFAQKTGIFLDKRDGIEYSTVRIGGQTWMAENLNAGTFRNGDPIPEAKTKKECIEAAKKKQPAWCYYDNNSGNGSVHGKLYNYYAIIDPRELVPEGWLLPSDLEWEKLLKKLGGEKINNFENISTKLKAENKWGTKKTSNESGFSALPSGMRMGYEKCGKKVKGNFVNFGTDTYYWSSSFTNHSRGCYLHLFIGFNDIYNGDYIYTSFPLEAGNGLSVRCYKND